MSKKSMHAVLMIACFIFSVSGTAAAGIVGSKHDFSFLTGGPPDGTNFALLQFQAAGEDIVETCVFCHTPHSAASAAATGVQGLLWNRTNSIAASFDVYTSGTLSVTSGATGLTLMCMSCHDGITSIAVGALINAPNPATNPSQVTAFGTDKIGTVWNVPTPNPFGFEWGANIGNLDPALGLSGRVANLTDDHPVSFTWILNNKDIRDPADWTGTGATALKLFNNRMECSTCHDVHNPAEPPFLRMSNVNSDMCTTCHIK
jgi:predicted CXXCH cytochrome family protein